MSNITKAVSRGIPSRERIQLFTSADAGVGDILKVEASLGRPAQEVSITSTSGMSVRFNVTQFVAPPREGNDLMYTAGMPNLALGTTYVDTSATPVTIAAGETLVIDRIPVKDIQLVTVSGTFSVRVC